MTAFLPQKDPLSYRRRRRLERERRLYRYSHSHVSPLATVDRVPILDGFSLQWLQAVGERVLSILANRAELELGTHHRDYYLTRRKLLRRMLAHGTPRVSDVRQMIEDALKFDGRIGAPASRPESLESYADLFRAIGLPPIARDFQDDAVFAWQRVAGANPVILARMSELDSRFPVGDANLQDVAPNDSLSSALAEGRLYMADYALAEDVELGDFPHGQKYLYAPLALFVVERASRQLLPVAIQCKQTPAADNPVFTPRDGHGWLIAKTVVEIADANIHETMTHLGMTHLFMEPFAVSTHRQLAANHPLSLLLLPHFEGTMAINEAAWKTLIANKGAVDKLAAGTIQASRAMAARAVQTARVSEILLPETFAARGVDDTECLPHYPYRADALLYWIAIQRWVDQYLRLYYHSDTDVRDDLELQAWGRELSSHDGGRIKGLGVDGSFASVSALVDAVTLIVYTCSVQHAAVNFPQYDLMSYVPNMPLAGYAPAPTTKQSVSEADYLNMLPPLDMAELQLEATYLLGSVHYTQLGQYGRWHFRDRRVDAPLANFQQQLAAIGKTIQQRNQQRRPYEFLMPRGIPQSINV